jgi:hypothetical protein
MGNNDETDYTKIRNELDKLNQKLWEKEQAALLKAQETKEKKDENKKILNVNKIQNIIKWVIIGVVILIIIIVIIILIYNLVSNNNQNNQNNQYYNVRNGVVPQPKPVIIEKPVYIEKIVEKPVYIEKPIQRDMPRQLYSERPVIQKMMQEQPPLIPRKIDRSEYNPVPVPPVKSYINDNNKAFIQPKQQPMRSYYNPSSSSFNNLFSSSNSSS